MRDFTYFNMVLTNDNQCFENNLQKRWILNECQHSLKIKMGMNIKSLTCHVAH